MSTDPNCIFCKIVAGQIPSKQVHEDDDLQVFHDIHPWAPVHILLIPKLHIASMAELLPEGSHDVRVYTDVTGVNVFAQASVAGLAKSAA